MDDKTKKDFILLFNQGFEEVVLPQIEDLREEISGVERSLKSSLNKLEKRVGTLEVTVDRMDRKLDIFSDKVSKHDVRLNNIESIPVIAHELKHKKSKSKK